MWSCLELLVRRCPNRLKSHVLMMASVPLSNLPLAPPPLPSRLKALPPEPTPAAHLLAAGEREATIGDLADEVLVGLDRAQKAATARSQRLREQMRDSAEADLLKLQARALSAASEDDWNSKILQVELPNISKELSAGDDCGAPTAQGEPGPLEPNSLVTAPTLTIKLPKPGRSLAENAAACIRQADKIEKANNRCLPLAEEASVEAGRWTKALEHLGRWRDQWHAGDVEMETTIRDLHAELSGAGHIKARVIAPPEDAAKFLRRKYGKEIDCFLSPSGHEVVVGRSAGANEVVSFELTRKDALWFHSDSAGSHVTIMCPATDVCSLEDVEFAASIAAWHSKARHQSVAAVSYVSGGQICRPPFRKLGLVCISGRRGVLHVTPALPAY